jgi:hypothetical protein
MMRSMTSRSPDLAQGINRVQSKAVMIADG